MDRRVDFAIALRELGVAHERALMVGDRASHDGGAARAGITTVLLPPMNSMDAPRGLDHVLALAGVSVQ